VAENSSYDAHGNSNDRAHSQPNSRNRSVGLKGNDGSEVLIEAMRRGAQPVTPDRCLRSLERLKQSVPSVRVITCPLEMGERETLAVGMKHELLSLSISGKITAADTRSCKVVGRERRGRPFVCWRRRNSPRHIRDN
jgi:hypothetical protein